MSAKTTQPTPEAPAQARGFPGLPCPCCGADDTVAVGLDALTEFACSACDAQWTADDVRRLVNGWEAVLVWLATAPAGE